jgi:hypothetical protein
MCIFTEHTLKQKKMKKCILIDSEKKTITSVEINGSLESIYKLLDCSTIAAPIEFENRDTMYVDDEGLYKKQTGGIMMRKWSYPIVGKVMIIGCDDEGESVDVKTPIEFFQKEIIWINESNIKRYQEEFQ